MKVAMVVDRFPKLSEPFVLSDITGLQDRGHEVDIYALKRLDDGPVQPEVERRGLLDRVRELPAQPLDDWGDYDIIHAQFAPLGEVARRLRAVAFLRGRLVTSFRGGDDFASRTGRGERAYEALFREGDGFLAESSLLRRAIIESGCDPGKVVVRGTGVDCRQFSPAPTRQDRPGPARLLSVGRLDEVKGFEYGIRAFARVAGSGADVAYEIVGEGDRKQSLLDLCAELGVTNRVRFPGWLRTPEVAELMKIADVFLAPSVTTGSGQVEGVPTVLKEAMASQVPVLATAHGGIPELVEDGVSGYLAPERDEVALAERLASLVASPSLRDAMGRAGRARVTADFDVERSNDRLVEVYSQVLTRAP